jgi:hypothetical protein
MIEISKYPQLKSITWDLKDSSITPKDAFSIYERRWSYVNEGEIQPNEQQIIKLLTKSIGKGFFLPSP